MQFASLNQTKQVSSSLQPGTAMNVTMYGNFTKIEAPYKAVLISYYANTTESMSRRIDAIVSTDLSKGII